MGRESQPSLSWIYPGRRTVLTLLLPVYKNVNAQAEQSDTLELWILVHDDGDDTDVWQEPPRPSNHVLAAEPVLAGGVEAPVVDGVVVALGQELDGAVLLLVELKHAVHDGDVAALNLKDNDFSHSDVFVLVVCQE